MFTQYFHRGPSERQTSVSYTTPHHDQLKWLGLKKKKNLQHAKHIYEVNWADPLFSLLLSLPASRITDAMCGQSPWQ